MTPPRAGRVVWRVPPVLMRAPLRSAPWIGVLSVLLLFSGFHSNAWRVVGPRVFERHMRYGDDTVVGRLAQSRHKGIFSSGGLLGQGSPDTLPRSDAELVDYQFHAYTEGVPFAVYYPYKSQVGGQGILFSCLDRAMRLSPQATLRVLRALTALLSSLVLTCIILWFFGTFGSWVALIALSSVMLSKGLVLFGGSLYWCPWAFYLPMVMVMLYLQSDRMPTRRHAFVFAGLVFLAVLVKCLVNGYEYITPTLLMMGVPVVFYAVRVRWRIATLLQYGFLAATASGLAILVTLAILCVQIAAVEGAFLNGAGHLLSVLGKRTHGNPSDYPLKYAESLNAGTLQVLAIYLKGTFLGVVRYSHLIAAFAAASIYVRFAARRDPLDERRKNVRALLVSTWFSILAPLSWFALFKAHAFAHPHNDFIVWQMPFTLYGFALCGIASQYAWRGFR